MVSAAISTQLLAVAVVVVVAAAAVVVEEGHRMRPRLLQEHREERLRVLHYVQVYWDKTLMLLKLRSCGLRVMLNATIGIAVERPTKRISRTTWSSKWTGSRRTAVC
jgi:hypothetical protein